MTKNSVDWSTNVAKQRPSAKSGFQGPNARKMQSLGTKMPKKKFRDETRELRQV